MLESATSCCVFLQRICHLKRVTFTVFAELFYTERAHVRMLRVLDNVFYQKLSKDAILPLADIKSIFTNLGEVLQLHGKTHELATSETCDCTTAFGKERSGF